MLPNNPIRILTLLVGLGALVAGADYLTDGGRDKIGQALLVLIPFGVGMIALATARPSDPGSAEGVTAEREPEPATVFEPVPARRYSAVIGMAGFMFPGLGMVFFPGDSPGTDPGAVRGIGACIALAFGALIFLTLRGIRRGHMRVVLTPDRIVQRGRLKAVEVPWDQIARVSWMQWRGAQAVVLHLSDRADVMVPTPAMAADPQVFGALVEHMRANPGDRPLLADPGGREALRRVGLAG